MGRDAVIMSPDEKKVKKGQKVKQGKKGKKDGDAKMDMHGMDIDAPATPQPGWLFKPAISLHDRELFRKQQEEKTQVVEFMKGGARTSGEMTATSLKILNLVGRFLSAKDMHFTHRIFALECEARGVSLRSGGVAGEVDLETVYEEWVNGAQTKELETSDDSGDSEDDSSVASSRANKVLTSSSPAKVNKSPQSTTSSATSSDSDADDEDEETTPVSKPTITKITPSVANKLKRKARTSSSSSPSASEPDSDSESSSGSSSGSDAESESASASASDSDSSSDTSEPAAKKPKLDTAKSAASVPLPPSTVSESPPGPSGDDSESSHDDSASDPDSSAAPPPKSTSAKSTTDKSRKMSEESSETILATSPTFKAAPAKSPSVTTSSSSSSSSPSSMDSPSPTVSKPKLSFPPPTTTSTKHQKRKRSLSPHSLRALATKPSNGTTSLTSSIPPPTPAHAPKAAKTSATSSRFSRIPADVKVDEKLASNKYVPYDYAQKAHEDLIITRGKEFTKAKNKKKRGSYKGGTIDVGGGKGIKFDD